MDAKRQPEACRYARQTDYESVQKNWIGKWFPTVLLHIGSICQKHWWDLTDSRFLTWMQTFELLEPVEKLGKPEHQRVVARKKQENCV